MKTKRDEIVLLGGGGHAKVLIDLINTSGQFRISGILDTQLEVGTKVLNVPVLGDDDLLSVLYSNGIRNVCISIGSVKDNARRRILFDKVKQMGFLVPYLLHPQAIIVSKNVHFSEGVQIMAGVNVQTDSLFKENTIINTGAIIEHDCNIGSHVHICPGAIISGGCTVGDGTFIGAGATIIHEIDIGKCVTVAAGAVVVKDVPDRLMVKGVPAV
jgi:sugar O-acyltransferase (sialic acid O-acetyltransferase NeuD family)